MLIRWRNDYNTGVQTIDSQHQQLVNMINKLSTAKENGQAKEVIKDILIGIVDYTRVHFSAEEAHMAENNYPLISVHKSQHKLLINQIVEILENYKSGKTEITDNLLKVLQNWLIKHVLDHDQQYGKYLQKSQQQ